MRTTDEIRGFIAKGETEKAVELLVQFTKEQKPALQNDAVLLSSRYQQWKRNVTIGINESSNDLRHIENGILTLLENSTENSAPPKEHKTTPTSQHTPTTSPPKESSSLIPIVIGLLGLGALIMIGFWAFGGDTNNSGGNKTTTTVTKPAETGKTNTATPNPPTKKPTTKTNTGTTNTGTKPPKTTDNTGVTQQPPTTKLPKINGKTVNLVEVDAGYFYRNIGNKKWVETNKKTFQNKNNFVETARDDWSVYLYDKAREVRMSIDLYRKKMTYADPNTKQRDQYTIVNAMIKAKGMEVMRVEYANGYFMLKEGKTWIEKNQESSDTFTETGRDEWSVYLTNQGKDIQLDLNLKKVMYNEKGKSLAPLYNITNSY